MNLKRTIVFHLTAAAIAAFFTPSSVSAADHGDSPAVAHDLGADINDVYFFLDPTDSTQTVLIATVHGFIVPGMAPAFAAFDENVKFRFEIYNGHVNFVSPVLDPAASGSSKSSFLKSLKVNRTIDITFSKREVGLGPQAETNGYLTPANLRRPMPQQATITLGGFSGLNGSVFRTDEAGNALLTTPVTTSTAAPPFDVRTIKVSPTASMKFFAGEVDDPFFFDVPAFNSFLDGIRNGTGGNAAAFNRARDTFAGYNTLAIAVRIPTALLLSDQGAFIGMDFLTQRHATEKQVAGGVKGSGGYKTVDRMGTPTMSLLPFPFDKKNAYNFGTARGDVVGQFTSVITESLRELGLVSVPPEAAYTKFMEIAVAYGDLLQIDTTISNFGSPGGAGFPNGRRLQDDTADYFLTLINHQLTVSDGVANSGSLTISFPFLGKPNQPLATGSGTDDATRN